MSRVFPGVMLYSEPVNDCAL